MTRFLFFAVASTVLLSSWPLEGRGQIAFWQRFFGGSAFDYGKKIMLLEDGSMLVAGEVQSTDYLGAKSHGGTDIVLFQYVTQGVRLWENTIGGTGNDELSDIIRTRDGGYLMVGATTSPDGDVAFNQGKYDAWVVRLNARGEVLWSKTFGGSGDDRLYCALEASDGRILVAGESGSMNGDMRSARFSRLDSWVAKLDAFGTLIWERHYGGNGNDKAVCLLETEAGAYLAIHATDSRDGQVTARYGGKDVWLTELSDFGDITWQLSLGGEGNDEVHDAVMLPDGGLILAGTTFSSSGHISRQQGEGDAWIVRLTPDRQVRWSRTFGGAKPDGANSIAVLPDGNFVLGGITKSNNGDIRLNQGYFDGWVFKLSEEGQLLWSRTLGGAAKDEVACVVSIPTGGFLLAGSAELPDVGALMPGHKGASDLWIANLGDPAKPSIRPYVTPPLLFGQVTEAETQLPIHATITLTDNKTLDSLSASYTRPDGQFAMMLPPYGLLSINVTSPGYLFFGEDLLMDTLVAATQVSRQIQLSKIKVGSTLILKRIYFEPGKWELLPASYPELERVVVFLNLNPRVVIQISGHTDNTGERGDKVQLSLNRAEAVKTYLVSKGIAPNRLRVKGYGMYRPIAPNTSPEGRAKNRRVEFEVQAI